MIGKLKVQLRNELYFVELSEVCFGEQTVRPIKNGRKALPLGQTGPQSSQGETLSTSHTPSIAFRHLPPNSARSGQRPPKGSGANITVEAA